MDEFSYLIAVSIPGLVCILSLAKALQIAFDQGTQGWFEVVSVSPSASVVLFSRTTRDQDADYLLQRMKETGCTAESAAIAQLASELTTSHGGGIDSVLAGLNEGRAKCITFGGNALNALSNRVDAPLNKPEVHREPEADPTPVLVGAVLENLDLNEVGEWVGLHYRVNLDGLSDQEKYGWISRFVAAHSTDPRFAAYLVCNAWGHMSVGNLEMTTRWVYRLQGGVQEMVAAQVSSSTGWRSLQRAEVDDLADSVIYGNDILTTWATDFADSVHLVTELPEWALTACPA